MTQEELEDEIKAAVRSGNIESVRGLLTSHPIMLRHDYGSGTWLHLAARRCNEALVSVLIELGSDVNAEAKGGLEGTPLNLAVNADCVPVARVLLEKGANPNYGRILIGAIVGPKKHSLELVKLLDNHGVDLHKVVMHHQLQQPMNSLSAAVMWDKEDVAEYLRSRGVKMPPEQSSGGGDADQVVTYFTEHFGKPKPQSLIEIVPTEPAIAIHVIPPAKDQDHVTLFTTGMSAKPMKLPAGNDDAKRFQYAELFIQLPRDWPTLGGEADPIHGWPFHWLRAMARNPHQNKTWLGGPVAVVDNGDPPEPLASNMKFDSLMLLAEKNFTRKDGCIVQLYRMIPLYPEERNLERREGIAALMRALDRVKTPFVVSLNRPNASK